MMRENRYKAIQQASTATRYALVLGTLGRQGSVNVLEVWEILMITSFIHCLLMIRKIKKGRLNILLCKRIFMLNQYAFRADCYQMFLQFQTIKKSLVDAGKNVIVVLLSELFPEKLKLFQDIEV